MRLVLDTGIVVAALRSPRGASALLLTRVRLGRHGMILTVPLALEYEAVLSRPHHLEACRLSLDAMRQVVSGLIAIAEPTPVWFSLRPAAYDPGDDLVIEAAVNGRADAIASFDLRHIAKPAARFGIPTLHPIAILRKEPS